MSSQIADIATTIATIVAIAALSFSMLSSVSESRQERANEIRRNLISLAEESSILVTHMNDGTALILGSKHVAEEILHDVKDEYTPAVLQEYYGQNSEQTSQTILALSISGWNKSPPSSSLDEASVNLRRSSVILTGDLELLKFPIDMYQAILNDGFSGLIFVRTLEIVLPDIVERANNGDSKSDLTMKLRSDLQSATTTYHFIKHLPVTESIDHFIQTAVLELTNLDDKSLIDLSSTRTINVDRTATRTESMRALLESLEGKIEPEQKQELEKLIQAIETSLKSAQNYKP